MVTFLDIQNEKWMNCPPKMWIPIEKNARICQSADIVGTVTKAAAQTGPQARHIL